MPETNRIRPFLESLREFVDNESAIAEQRLIADWSKPLAQKLAAGSTLKLVSVERGNDAGQIIASFEQNNSRFREGDLVCLHLGEVRSDLVERQLQIREERDDHFVLEVQRATAAVVEETGGHSCYLDRDNLDLRDFYLQTLRELADTAHGRDWVLPILMGMGPQQADDHAFDIAHELAREEGCNASQVEAVACAHACDKLFCVQGPPGTGKTWVLSLVAGLAVARGERVLVTSHTHTAINNALNKIHARGIPLIKVGPVHQRQTLHPQVDCADSFVAWKNRPPAYVVGATPFATCTRRLKGVVFDTVIFDEASQLTVPLAAMAMRAGKKYLLFGDHQQLPPVVQSRSVLDCKETSIFSTMVRDEEHSTMLTTSFRLNAELVRWPSKTFYNGRLSAAAGSAQNRFSLPRVPEQYAGILSSEHSAVFIQTENLGATTKNPWDAAQIANLCKELVSCGLSAEEIGIVTPYRAQARLIKLLLRETLGYAVARRIVADTVERMQGQEREVILLSLVTSDLAFLRAVAEFYFQPQRLNVSFTRARTKLVVIGDRAMADFATDDAVLAEQVDIFRGMLSACHEVAV
jgi:DNA replication ATP-dependent helicase Dna2